MRGLDEPDDLLQRAFARQPPHHHLDRAPQIERAAEHRFPRVFLHRLRFTSERRLVARRLAFDDIAVRRKHLARLHEHVIADADLFSRDLVLTAIRLHPHRRRLRRRWRRLYRLRQWPRWPLEREFLHRTRSRKQEKQQRRLTPSSDGHGSRCHREHEKVNIQLQAAQLLPGVFGGIPPAG